jgi:T-complex protein 1 subunit delta
MDKMVVSGNGDVTITNDGATILQKMRVTQPAARMFVELSKSQDVVAGDGTTTVTVLAGSILGKCMSLVSRGVHPTAISDALGKCVHQAVEVLRGMAVPVDLGDRETLIKAASTSLNSKVVSQYAQLLAPLAVDCVLRIQDPAHPESVDLRDVRVVKRLGGTVDDTEVVDGVVFDHKASKSAGGPTRVEQAKIGLIQFCVSPPKTDIENSVVVSDYAQMDRILRDERNYILGMVKKIKASGCNVLLIQKSILRDAVNDLALHYLAKAKILVVRDIERDEIEYLAKTLGLSPIAHVDSMRPEKLADAELVEELPLGSGRVVRVTGIKNRGATACVLLRGSNQLMLEEADRSLHDALCVVRCLVHNRAILPGGGAPEIEVSRQLGAWAKTLSNGTDALCARAFADALEVVPYTLAENSGLNAISIVTELRNLHAAGNTHHGINVRKGCISDMVQENVVQPLLVTTSALTLATECVRMILRIDDIVPVR